MAEEDLSDDFLAAASNLICRAANAIASTSTSDGLIDRRAFSELSSCLRRTLVILRELDDTTPSASISLLDRALESISEAADAVAAAASSSIDHESPRRSRLYLVISSRQTSRRLSSAARDLYHALSILPLSSSAQDEVEAIRDRLVTVEFRASSAIEEIMDKIESSVCDRESDRAYANHLLSLVADAAGVSHDPLTLRVELGKLRAEVAETRERKDFAEAVQMDQIVSFLSISDSVSSFREREERYFSKRNRLGSQPLELLRPFLCPITGDVMDDPVETYLGHTFEKTAIEKWFAEGNNTCPLTMTPLSVGDMRPNFTLKKSIEEWRERNRIISIANLKTKFESNDEQEVIHCLGRLEELYKEDSHRDWIFFENYLPLLVGLLERKSLEIRCRALFVLNILAKDSDDTKEQLGGINKLIEFVVMSLGRRSEERKLAVALLLELSRIEMVRNKIGKVRGCIFLLVTNTNDGNQAATDATQLLENLSYLDENVVKMAKANYFKPLLQCLRSGNDDVKKIMVTTLAEIEVPDQSKAALFRNGALDVLLNLVKHSDPDIKTMAVKSLQSLSSLPENGVKMIREGALSPLLHLLRHHHCTSSHILSEQAAATIMNIVSSAVDLKDDESLILLKFNEDIFWLFSLVNLTGPSIQQSILRTFYALCNVTSAEDIKYKLRQCHAIEVLIPHCQNNNISVRLNAIKLLSCLTENIDFNVLADSRFLKTLQSIIKTSKDDEEIIASMNIISSLPPDSIQIIQWLLEENGLSSLIQFIKNTKLGGSTKNELTGNAVRALCHFTIPSNIECQKKAVQAGAISHLVHLLEFGTSLSKKYAAISLAQFSENSFKLSEPIAKRRVFFCCAAAAPEAVCEVHNGVCSVEHSFCLLEAEAVLPLVRLLSEPDLTVNEAALTALSTLIVDERLQSGSKLLFEMNGIVPIIKLLNSASPDVQVKSAIILERIFRLEEYKKIYGASAQMSLIYITHKGNSMIRALAAKILAHLNVLHEQSSYF